ncbi:SCAN domain-containing protein 3-like [Eriocheir sinensis]|uniref:SCAN domain-containing protein 3-like n=1 Tax=Eriocheir sinensis TaxID=95602 RepID=UPI0021C9B87A|nr:SCAN domain-containing protein 3-like [Eriocheir sinensis]XP_050708191.1 SCAN domain-containing protein 3-like [Eriocheir sinensis]
MAKCRGLGFDGASAMMGKFKGCAAVLMKKYTLAKPIHCSDHRQNLVLTKPCDVKEVKIALQTLTEVCNFVHSSNMHCLRFTEVVKLTSAKREELVPLCPTRWIERHDAVLVFVEFLPVIAVFLEEELDATAGLLLIAIHVPRFLVGLVVVECTLAHTLKPSRTLQRKDGDLVSAYARFVASRPFLASSEQMWRIISTMCS